MRCSSTHVRAAGHCHPRLLGPIAAVALLAMTVGSVSAAGPTVGAAGVMRSATFTDDMAPAWKTQLLALHTKRDAGMMTAADATAWNNIIDAQGLDPAARISTAGPSASGGIVPMATSRDLTGTQQPQTQTYYCGPASGQSIVLAWHNVESRPLPDGVAMGRRQPRARHIWAPQPTPTPTIVTARTGATAT